MMRPDASTQGPPSPAGVLSAATALGALQGAARLDRTETKMSNELVATRSLANHIVNPSAESVGSNSDPAELTSAITDGADHAEVTERRVACKMSYPPLGPTSAKRISSMSRESAGPRGNDTESSGT